MKITENEVEVVRHPSVIGPLLLFLFTAEGRQLCPRVCSSQADTG